MRKRTRAVLVGAALVVAGGALYATLGTTPRFPSAPDVDATWTPSIRRTPLEIGSVDTLGHVLSRAEADALRTQGQDHVLAPEQGAVEITADLVRLGRRVFYEETFGNEVFFSDVVGVLDGPLGPKQLVRALRELKGAATTNLRVRLDEAARVGTKVFPAGTVLDTGLDVPKGAMVPLGMRVRLSGGHVQVGITCAACHATVDTESGRILEGAPNLDLRSGLLMAFGTNSAALFRQTGARPTIVPATGKRYLRAEGTEAQLPDPVAFEAAVDDQLLAWPPGNFDSTGDVVNNPAQIPTSFTFDAWPYGWSGFASVGWFHGLTTLNNNVHATNSDVTTGADSSEPLLGIDKETYLGVIFQAASRSRYRLPEGERPSAFFTRVDPTPGAPGMNTVVALPTYPKGSLFALDGLLAGTKGHEVGEELNAMSAWQNTLAPPPHEDAAEDVLRRGAEVFVSAGCASCHTGRTFTNHAVVPAAEIGTEPSRARALAAFPKVFAAPSTYAPTTPIPVPKGAAVLSVPTDVTPDTVPTRAFARDGEGGYKVPSLVGLAVSAPYLHDGGVAAGAGAFGSRLEGGGYVVVEPRQLGMAALLRERVLPDPKASLRALVDRRLRAEIVAANRAMPELGQTHVDGSGHEFWVDTDANARLEDQDALLEFLLSLDDDPRVLPSEATHAERARLRREDRGAELR